MHACYTCVCVCVCRHGRAGFSFTPRYTILPRFHVSYFSFAICYATVRLVTCSPFFVVNRRRVFASSSDPCVRASNELIATSLALRSKRNISFVLIDAIVLSLTLSRYSRDISTTRVASRESRNGGSTEPGCRCARLPIAAERKHPVSRLREHRSSCSWLPRESRR